MCIRDRAHRCAELHQRLVEVARAVARHNCGKSCFHAFLCPCIRDIGTAGKYAGNDAQHIAVHCGDGNAKSDGSDCACGVAADTGQRKQVPKRGGKVSAELFYNDLCLVLLPI